MVHGLVANPQPGSRKTALGTTAASPPVIGSTVVLQLPLPKSQAAAAPNSGLQRLESTSAPLVTGGIALGMTECQAVQRAGTPSSVAISTGDKGERKVVLTYLSGPRPGIYTFSGGRLNVVEWAPEQPKSAKPAAKKTPKKKPANTAQFQQAQ